MTIFSEKITKIAQRLGAFPTDPIASSGWRLHPQTPDFDTLSRTIMFAPHDTKKETFFDKNFFNFGLELQFLHSLPLLEVALFSLFIPFHSRD